MEPAMTARPRVSFLTSADMMKGRPGAREDWFEYDLEFGALSRACEAEGIELVSCIWDQPFEDDGFSAFMIGTVWDYPPKQALFLETIDRLNAKAPVLNSPAIVRWNIEKTYLRELDEAGAPSVPTLWRDAANAETIAEAFETFGADEIVVKPQIGAGAWRQARVKKGEALPAADQLPPAACMLQPFLPSIPEEGEYSLMVFGGQLSHGLVKRPKQGDYRVQSMYGATEEVWSPSEDERALALDVLHAAERITGEEDLLYARIDMARGLDGKLAVMELELIEPYFYPEQGPNMGQVFVEALKKKL
jgi:glutathione synthase/RimK-type ligase-like ATP-grasp enzyme